MSLGTILLIVLVLMLIGAIPTWPHSSKWGYGPSGILGVVLIIVLGLGGPVDVAGANGAWTSSSEVARRASVKRASARSLSPRLMSSSPMAWRMRARQPS